MVTDDGQNDHKIKPVFNNIKKVLKGRTIYVALRLKMLHLDCDTVDFAITKCAKSIHSKYSATTIEPDKVGGKISNLEVYQRMELKKLKRSN